MAVGENVVCCFCGLRLVESDAVRMVVWPTQKRDESQILHSHRVCLLNRLHPDVPAHPALADEIG